MIVKGRGNKANLKGEDHGRAKLTEKKVKEIRQEYDFGEFTQKELAKQFGVSKPTIWAIVNRKIWMHVC
jgi:DNA-binding XRE family transcriptional regulator